VPSYLRTDPATQGNAARYKITTDNTGAVYVTQVKAAVPVATNFETTPAICQNIP